MLTDKYTKINKATSLYKDRRNVFKYMKLLLIYIFSLTLMYGNTLEYVKETKTSVFTINLLIKNKKNVLGKFCYVTRNGAKIDCDNKFNGILKNNKVYFDFNSSFGGKNGKAVISFISKTQIEWTLLSPPQGEFYTPKKAILTLNSRSAQLNEQTGFNKHTKMKSLKENIRKKNNQSFLQITKNTSSTFFW